MKKASFKKKILVPILVGVAIWQVVSALHPRPLDSVMLPGYGLGQALAETASTVLNNQGRLVVVYAPADTVEVKSQWEGFKNTIKKHGGMRIIKVYNLKTDISGYVEPQSFLDMVKEQDQSDLIVSFLPVAPATQKQVSEASSRIPKMLVVGLTHDDGNPERCAASGLKAIIVPRIPTSLPSENMKSAKDWFDYYFEIKLL